MPKEIPFVIITPVQRDNLLAFEKSDKSKDMALPAGEDDAFPTDFCYLCKDGSGNYELDESAYIHAERFGFDWSRSEDPMYKDIFV